MARKNSFGVEALIDRVLAGEAAAASRALSLVIDESPESEQLSAAFFQRSGTVPKIGFCGPPGAGKSTLVGRLVSHFRRSKLKIGILAVDPSSHISGGAFLGDRLRIQEHATDPGVFMRSVATRGMVGGLSHTIFGAIHVLEAYGCERILIETVGTGQDEVEIARVADTVVYVTTPQLGDEIQAMKAGAMEIGDFFVINKSELDGADKAVGDLKSALGLASAAGPNAWKPRIVKTSALQGGGIEDLAGALEEHREHLRATSEGQARLKTQHRYELSMFISRRLYKKATGGISEKHLDDLLARRTDPASLGMKLLRGAVKA